MSDVLSEPQVK